MASERRRPGGGLERGELGRWVRAGSAVRLAGGLKLSERRRHEESKAGAAVWGKVWHFYVRRLVLKGAVQGRWQGIQGLPLQPAVSQGLELMATGQNVGASSMLARQN